MDNCLFSDGRVDYKALDHPKEYILDKGGAILVALYKDEPVGVCALCKMDHPLYDYELVNWLSALRFRAKVLEYCFAKQL
ncbi:hypothetical protein NXX23_23480 [Bacteroides ovatus]|nr:hypothetical protein [Bacteroides ovatus]